VILTSSAFFLGPPSSHNSAAITPFRACFTKASIANPSDFISMEPNACGSISFAITANDDKDHQLSIIQVKKINSLFSWYHKVTSPVITQWFYLDDADFQVWHMLPSTSTLGAMMLLNPEGIPPPSSSPIYDLCKSVKCSISDWRCNCSLFWPDQMLQ
jgi:hypothetical protein